MKARQELRATADATFQQGLPFGSAAVLAMEIAPLSGVLDD
ncbi:hypothetical protein WNY61_06540 [Sulfitobacter sp. AS92]